MGASIDTKKVASASKALKKYLKEHEDGGDKSQLFEDDGEFIYLVLKSKKFFAEDRNLKPKLVELPDSIWKHRSEKPSICAFVRDPQRTYKDALLDGETQIQRCIGVSKLKGKFKPFEARRALRSDFDIFLSDDDVVRMLPKLLGKSFYDKQQSVPIPVKMKTKSGNVDASKVKKSISTILNSTVLVYPASQTMLVRIATTKHSDKEVAQNAKAVVDAVGLKNILSLSIRTSHSPTLPVFYAEKIYSESDIGEEDADDGYETEGQKRKREEAHLDELLAEVADEEDIKEYNRNMKRLRKQKGQSILKDSTATTSTNTSSTPNAESLSAEEEENADVGTEKPVPDSLKTKNGTKKTEEDNKPQKKSAKGSKKNSGSSK